MREFETLRILNNIGIRQGLARLVRVSAASRIGTEHNTPIAETMVPRLIAHDEMDGDRHHTDSPFALPQPLQQYPPLFLTFFVNTSRFAGCSIQQIGQNIGTCSCDNRGEKIAGHILRS